MIGYLILSKKVNESAPDGYDYAPVSEIISDALDADYALAGFAEQDQMEFIVAIVDER